MAKTAFDAARQTVFLFDPDDLVLVVDKDHVLYQDRVHLPVKEEIVLNMMVKGFRSTIIVKRDGDKPLVVDGRQRVKAAREANRRLKAEGKEPLRVRAFLEKGEDIDLFGVMVLSNKGRQDDDPMTEAAEVQKYINQGRTEDEAAAVFCMPKSRVKQLRSLFECAPKVQKAVTEGKVSASAAAKLAKIDSADQVEKLDELLTAGGGKATVAKVARAVKAKTTGNAGPEKPTTKQVKHAIENLREGYPEAAAALEWALTGNCGMKHIQAKLNLAIQDAAA